MPDLSFVPLIPNEDGTCGEAAGGKPATPAHRLSASSDLVRDEARPAAVRPAQTIWMMKHLHLTVRGRGGQVGGMDEGRQATLGAGYTRRIASAGSPWKSSAAATSRSLTSSPRVRERATIQRGLCEINNQPAGQAKRSMILLLSSSLLLQNVPVDCSPPWFDLLLRPCFDGDF